MGTLSLALYCEGSTDQRFLAPVIIKTSREILNTHQQIHIEVLPIHIIENEKRRQREAILLAAHQARGYHALIIHADADDPEPHKARSERFEPGYALVQQVQEDICKDVLPIIPVQAIEAWMLADHELLLEEIGTGMRPDELNIPTKANLVETIAKPKQRLRQAVQLAYASRRKRQRDIDIDFLYEPIGERIRLERLHSVSSYNQFVHDLTAILKKLALIP